MNIFQSDVFPEKQYIISDGVRRLVDDGFQPAFLSQALLRQVLR